MCAYEHALCMYVCVRVSGTNVGRFYGHNIYGTGWYIAAWFSPVCSHSTLVQPTEIGDALPAGGGIGVVVHSFGTQRTPPGWRGKAKGRRGLGWREGRKHDDRFCFAASDRTTLTKVLERQSYAVINTNFTQQ